LDVEDFLAGLRFGQRWMLEKLPINPWLKCNTDLGVEIQYRLVNILNDKVHLANDLRYWQLGGRDIYLGAEKTRNQKNALKWRRIPPVQ